MGIVSKVVVDFFVWTIELCWWCNFGEEYLDVISEGYIVFGYKYVGGY